ncbi:MAG: DHA2 family efflux MFS transporter permease subunit [Alphaproteobacteria bacterium]|nr:DHA2 family efflux MFS transporter permease subunit [Alphaproteobacteria bacterium]
MASETIEGMFERYGPAYRWLAAATCMVGAMTVVLSMTTVNVAFPDIMGAFGIGRDQAQLLSSGYFAAMTAGMVLSSWLISIFGERTTYASMLAIFIFGSALSGLANDTETLTFGRLLQGTTAGVIQPLAMAVTFKVFPPARRGTAMGLFSMGIVFAPAMGPTLGGIAIELFNWRYVFLLTVPSAIVAVVMGAVFMPSRSRPKSLPKFDFVGLGLMVMALLCLMLALSSGQREGWASDYIVMLFLGGVVAALAFLFWESHTPEPLLNLALFRYARFSSAALIALFSGSVFLTSTFLVPVFVQQVQGYTPLRAGLLLMPGGLSLLFLFPIAGRISDTVPAHYLIAFGLCSFGLAFIFLAGTDVNTPFWTFVFYTLFIRVGIAFTSPVVNATALKALPTELVNQGSGAINFVRQLGAAFGMNIVVAFLEFRIPFHGDALTATQTIASGASREMLGQVGRILSEAGVPEAAQTPGALHYLGEVIYAQASTMGFQDAFISLSMLAFFGLIPAWILYMLRDRRGKAG